MEQGKYRVIKISKEALFEFIYEKFNEDLEDFMDVNPIDVSNTFDVDFENGEFIAITHQSEDEEGRIISLPEEVDTTKLLKNLPDTTPSMFEDGRFQEFTLEELLKVQQTEKSNLN